MAEAKKAKPAAKRAKPAAARTLSKASKARVPLLAGGAAVLAGAAGGALIGAARARKRHRFGEAAKGLGNLGMQVGHLASELQQNREGENGARQHRSPIEVVLEGLTARRTRA